MLTEEELQFYNLGRVLPGAPHGFWTGDSGVSEGAAGGGANVAALTIQRGTKLLLACRNIFVKAIAADIQMEVKWRGTYNLQQIELQDERVLNGITSRVDFIGPVYHVGGEEGASPDTQVISVQASNVDTEDIRVYAHGVWWDLNTLEKMGVGPDLRFG